MLVEAVRVGDMDMVNRLVSSRADPFSHVRDTTAAKLACEMWSQHALEVELCCPKISSQAL